MSQQQLDLAKSNYDAANASVIFRSGDYSGGSGNQSEQASGRSRLKPSRLHRDSVSDRRTVVARM